MKHTEIAKAIMEELGAYASESRKEKISINHPTSLQVFGLMISELRTVIAKWQKELIHQSAEQWIELALSLVNTNNLEGRLVAYEFLWKNNQALQALTTHQILALGKNLDNWVSVDTYCLSVTGYCWQKGMLQDEIIEQWALHPDRWIRRSALVSTVPLNLRARGGKGDVQRTLRICSLLVDDREDMVIKALSWALRELSKSDKQAVEGFMLQYKDSIHSRVKREVATKLLTGKKNSKIKQIN